MTDAQKREGARQFFYKWKGIGQENQHDQSYWIDLFSMIFGITDATDRIEFQKPVIVDGHKKRIDAYIPETRVIIEQKSLDIDLSKKGYQSGDIQLTPYEQAKRYNDNLPSSEKVNWIITSNFSEIWIYNMDSDIPENTVEKIKLTELQDRYPALEILLKPEIKTVTREMELSLKAGELVGKIYDKLLEQYLDPDSKESQNSLNVLCVRLVFCLYADDAGLFNDKDAFKNFLMQFDAQHLRQELALLFKVLDTPFEDRPKMYLSDELEAFPYCNGGLFSDETIEIPKITPEIVEILLESSIFNWSEISPTIFGAVFESTLNPETRRSGGMHYTSIENIHKVIDPLFLDDLRAEFESIKAFKVDKVRNNKLQAFQKKLGELKFLDPACGSGNFLTETYLSLRGLENEIFIAMRKGQMMIATEFLNPIQVTIDQFYGIEINDFAVTVAKTALWIAESQMMKKTEDILLINLTSLPLKTNATIMEGNALRMDWNEVCDKNELNYIIGNPPFVGQAMRTKEQAEEIQKVFHPSKAGGKLDYVAGWFKKASDYVANSNVEIAFVSSNSICQGESVNLLWELLFQNGIIINFAFRTFAWNSEANEKANVHCVIVGFSENDHTEKKIFDGDNVSIVKHINGYLMDAPDMFIKNRSKSVNGSQAKVVQGSPPADDGRLLLNLSEYDFFLQKWPELKNVIKPFVGSREFINDIGFTRYCFWFVNEEPSNYQHIKELLNRFDYVSEYRKKSSVDRIRKTADRPYLFTQNRQPKEQYLLIPRVSSSSRRYIPIGFLSPDVIASDSVVVVNQASLYDFGILCSNVHNAWVRVVAGRLKSDYRYAPSVFYNFPFPNIAENEMEKIKMTAQMILNARKKYPTKSLANMYGKDMHLYPELMKAHRANDKAVMAAYGLSVKDTSEADCVAHLMRMYEELTGK